MKINLNSELIISSIEELNKENGVKKHKEEYKEESKENENEFDERENVLKDEVKEGEKNERKREYYRNELAKILNEDKRSINKIQNWVSDYEIEEIVNKWKLQNTYRLGRRLNINEKTSKALTKSYRPANIDEIVNYWQNQHTIDLKKIYGPYIMEKIKYKRPEILNYMKYLEIMFYNYSSLQKTEIIKSLKEQKEYDVYFYHQHEGIDGDLIKKYLILDECDYDVTKITLDTPERHDCNLVKLTPELQEKTYWGIRGNRRIVSHLINREDYPKENKTNKLTVIGKREYGSYDDKTYFLVITAFRGDGKSRREPKYDPKYMDNDYEDMEFRMNHALIPEKDEKITQTDPPEWVEQYQQQKKEKEMKSIYQEGKGKEYKAFQRYIKEFLLKIGRQYSNLEVAKRGDNFGNVSNEKNVDNIQYVIARNEGNLGIIEVNKTGEDIEYRDDEDIEEYKKRISEKEYKEGFSAKVIKNIENQNYKITTEIVDFRQNLIKDLYKYIEYNDILEKIIKTAEEIKHEVRFDDEGNKISTIIVGNKEYQFLNPNLEKYSDKKYSSYGHSDYDGFKKIEADLDGIRGDDPDLWQNKKLAEYIKTKKTEGFTIPGESLRLFLTELGKENNIENIREQLLLRKYLTGMEGDFWYSTKGEKIKFSYGCFPVFWENTGNVSGGFILMRCKQIKE